MRCAPSTEVHSDSFTSYEKTKSGYSYYTINLCVTEGLFKRRKLNSETHTHARTHRHTHKCKVASRQSLQLDHKISVTADLVSHVQKLFYDPTAKPNIRNAFYIIHGAKENQPIFHNGYVNFLRSIFIRLTSPTLPFFFT